jgi:hypothetical protein
MELPDVLRTKFVATKRDVSTRTVQSVLPCNDERETSERTDRLCVIGVADVHRSIAFLHGN